MRGTAVMGRESPRTGRPTYCSIVYLSARFDGGLAVLSTHGCRDSVIWSAPQQESHSVSPLRESRLPHPKEEVRVLRLSRRPDALLRMGQEGPRQKDSGVRSHGTLEEGNYQVAGNLLAEGLNVFRSLQSDRPVFLRVRPVPLRKL
jgi:hypothetical protein